MTHLQAPTCAACGHTWSTDAEFERSLEPSCTTCRSTWRRLPKNGVSLVTSHPHLAAEFVENVTDPVQYAPELIAPGSGATCVWRCTSCSHTWAAKVANRVSSGNGCPACAREARLVPKEGKSLLETNPTVAAQFVENLTRSDRDHPSKIRPRSRDLCRWECQACGHGWETQVNVRVNKDSGCPKCSRVLRYRPKSGQSLTDKHPGVASEFISNVTHPDVNSPDLLKPSSEDRCSWRCPAGHPDYVAQVGVRTRGSGCPLCGLVKSASSMRSPRAGRSLKKVHPLLAEEFIRNLRTGQEDPSFIAEASSDRCLWRCRAGCSDYEAVVNNRTRGKKTGCPICARSERARKKWMVAPEESIEAVDPDMAEGFLENLTHPDRGPDVLGVGSGDYCRWLCRCGKEVVATVDVRSARAKLDCVKCSSSAGTSRFEAEVAALLTAHTGLVVEHGVKVKGLGRLERIDLFIPELGWYVDVDPAYYHQDAARDRRKSVRMAELPYHRLRDATLRWLPGNVHWTLRKDAEGFAEALHAPFLEKGLAWRNLSSEEAKQVLASTRQAWRSRSDA